MLRSMFLSRRRLILAGVALAVGTVVAANGALFVANRNQLISIAEKK